MVHVFDELGVNGVVIVWWTVQHTYQHEVVVEWKPELDVFLGVWAINGE